MREKVVNYEYPKKLQIGGHKYVVQLHNNYVLDKAGDCAGLHCSEHSSIDVSTMAENGDQRSISRINQILLHEISHAINNVWGTGLDEGEVDRFSQGLLQLHEQLGIRLIKEA